MFIYRRDQKVKLSANPLALLKMWRLSRFHGIKPWEQNADYDEHGNPIPYKDDLDALVYLDALEEDGRAHYDWRKSKGIVK